MFKSRAFIAAVITAAFGQASLATTGATANSEESFAIHPGPDIRSNLTREEVRAQGTVARPSDAAIDLWTAPDGGNSARVPGGAAGGTTAMGAAPRTNAALRPTASFPSGVYFGNAD
jgi:hypothetical protein